jgi:hypothetical protein
MSHRCRGSSLGSFSLFQAYSQRGQISEEVISLVHGPLSCRRGMTLMQLARAVNETPAVITGNIVQIARIETRGGFDPDAFYF